MKIRRLLYNSVTVSLPKNIIQYMLGFVLFWLIYRQFDLTTFVLSLSGFLLAYSAVYFFNDIVDYEDDKKDREKRDWKLIAGGIISRRTAILLGTAFLVSGLLLSSLVNLWYLNIIVLVMFLNMLHSHPRILLKKNLVGTTINMSIIEFFKYSTGWFAFTGDLTQFPFWILVTFAVVYATIYIVYKFKFQGDMLRNNKPYFIVLALVVLLSYIFSVVIYDFSLPLLLLLGLSMVLVSFGAIAGKNLNFMNWLHLEFVIMPAMIVAFLLISIPMISQINTHIGEKITNYKDTVYKELPEGVGRALDNLSEPKYKSVKEVGEVLNRSLNLSLREFLTNK